MVAHVWAFPWLALLCGCAALFVALLRASLRSLFVPPRPGTLVLGVVWIAAIAALFALSERVGDTAGIDVVPARGVLLGALAGLVLTGLARSALAPRLAGLAVFGAATTALSAARLWLTHGEVSGLTAVAVSTAVTCLLLRVVPGLGEAPPGSPADSGLDETAADPRVDIAVLGSLYMATLAGGIEIGFTRAAQLNQMYWPDMTLLISGIVCLGLLVASAIARPSESPGQAAASDDETSTKSTGSGRRILAAAIPILLLLVSAQWLSKTLVLESTTIKVVAAGLFLWVLVPMMSLSGGTRGTGLGILVAVVAVGVAYNYWAGYGVALLLIAGWTAVSAIALSGLDLPADADSQPAENGPAGIRERAGDAWASSLPLLAFGLLMALRRLLVLQNDSFEGSTDSWGLLALASGACLPFLPAFTLPAVWTARRNGLAALGAVALLLVPLIAIAYLFATQSLANVFFGIALASLLTGVTALPAARRRAVLLNASAIGLFLLLLVPLAANWKEPTRRVKTELLAGLAVAAAVAQIAAARPRVRVQEA